MDNLVIVATQVAVLFALMAFGAAARWTKLVDDRAMGGIVNVLIILVTPCLIVDCFQRPYDPAMLQNLGLAFVIAVAAHLVPLALAGAVIRNRDESVRRPLLLAAVFGNAGFMGVPLEQAILGSRGVFFGAVYIVVFNLFIWSWGYLTMRPASGNKPAALNTRLWLNPGTVGIALGLPLFLLSVRLPAIVATPIHEMSNLNTPLAMIVIGYGLAGAKLGRVATCGSVWVASALRLVACPLAVLALLYPFRSSLDRDMMLALVIAAGTPVAAMVSMFATKFGRDTDVAVALVSGTTLLSIATMPVVIALALSLL